MSIGTVITEGLGSFGDPGHVVTQGFDIGIANADATILTQAFGKQAAASAFVVTEGFQAGVAVTPPTGQVQQGTGSGADSQWDWRWYEGQELLPNWYEYPEEVKRLRAEIARVKKQKRKLEQSLSFAKGADDLQAKLDASAKLQNRLTLLLAALQEAVDDEGDEFMEMLTEIL